MLPAAFWFMVIMVLLSLPGESFPTVEIWKPDKIAHVLLFGMQAVLLWIGLEIPRRIRFLRLPPLPIAAVATVLFGAASEGYQHVFTSRLADPYDVIANVAGVLLALLIVRALHPPRLLGWARSLLRLPA
jgi:VanZ family protein